MGQQLNWFVITLFSVVFNIRGRDRKLTTLPFRDYFCFADALSHHDRNAWVTSWYGWFGQEPNRFALALLDLLQTHRNIPQRRAQEAATTFDQPTKTRPNTANNICTWQRQRHHHHSPSTTRYLSTVHDHECLEKFSLKHERRPEFYNTRISDEDEAEGFTWFFRWQMDAALYDLCPPKVTALYAIKVPFKLSDTMSQEMSWSYHWEPRRLFLERPCSRFYRGNSRA